MAQQNIDDTGIQNDSPIPFKGNFNNWNDEDMQKHLRLGSGVENDRLAQEAYEFGKREQNPELKQKYDRFLGMYKTQMGDAGFEPLHFLKKQVEREDDAKAYQDRVKFAPYDIEVANGTHESLQDVDPEIRSQVATTLLLREHTDFSKKEINSNIDQIMNIYARDVLELKGEVTFERFNKEFAKSLQGDLDVEAHRDDAIKTASDNFFKGGTSADIGFQDDPEANRIARDYHSFLQSEFRGEKWNTAKEISDVLKAIELDGENTPENRDRLDKAAVKLSNMDLDDTEKVVYLLGKMGELEGEHVEGFWKKAGKNLGRAVESLAINHAIGQQTLSAGIDRDILMRDDTAVGRLQESFAKAQADIDAGNPVGLGDLDEGLQRMLGGEIYAQSVKLGSKLFGDAAFSGESSRKITAEELEAIKDRVSGAGNINEVKKRIFDAKSSIARIDANMDNKWDNWVGRAANDIENAIYTVPGSIPMSLASVVATPLAFSSYFGETYQEGRDEGLSHDQAFKTSMMSSAPKVYLNRLATKAATWQSKRLNKFLDKIPSPKIRGGLKFGAGVGVEFAEERLQDSLDEWSQSLLKAVGDEDMPELSKARLEAMVTLDPRSWWDKETFLASLAFGLAGAGPGAITDMVKNTDMKAERSQGYRGASDAEAKRVLKSKNTMKSMGHSEQTAEEVSQAANEGNWVKAGMIYEAAEKKLSVKEVKERVIEAHKDGTAKKAQVEAIASDPEYKEHNDELKQAGMPYVVPPTTPEGKFQIIQEGEPVVEVDMEDVPAALFKAESLHADEMYAMRSENVQKMVKFLQENMEGVEANIDENTRLFSEEYEDGIITYDQMMDRVNAYEKANGLKVTDRSDKAKGVARGKNFSVHGRNKLRQEDMNIVMDIFKGADAHTVIEEGAEGYIKRQIAEGTITEDWLKAKMLEYQSNAGGNVIDENSESNSVLEYFSDVAQAYIMGDVGNEQVPDGLRQILSAILQKFSHLMKMAADLVRMKSEGVLDADLENLLASSVGLRPGQRYEAESMKADAEVDQTIEETIAPDEKAAMDKAAAEREAGADDFDFSVTPVSSDGRMTPEGDVRSIQTTDGRVLTGATNFSISAFHGTPHKVDKFSTDRIGTGEGAQVYGHGLYFAQDRKVAESYRDTLAPLFKKAKTAMPIVSDRVLDAITKTDTKAQAIRELESKLGGRMDQKILEDIEAVRDLLDSQYDLLERYDEIQSADSEDNQGNLYEVSIKSELEQMLDWDEPLSNQSDFVRNALKSLKTPDQELTDYYTSRDSPVGASIYKAIYSQYANDDKGAREASKVLTEAGIKGVKYLDGNSRSEGGGNFNFVVFDDSDIEIKTENGVEVSPNYSITPAQDAEYMAAVESGDTEKAQSMVDEAAQKAGYKEKWLHGTINSGFTHFDKNKVANSILGKGFYFTSSDQAAENYASKDVRVNFDLVGKIEKLAKEKDIDYNSAKAEIMQGESSVDEYFIRRRGSLEVFKGETLFHHINSERLEGKVADNNGKEIDVWTLAKLTDEVKGKKAEEVLKTLNKYNASSSLTSIAEALGYTSILLDETLAPKGQAGEEQIIVFNPNQIKSADPVTYDSEGNPIPLSERFDEGKDSINYSITPAKKIAKAKGIPTMLPDRLKGRKFVPIMADLLGAGGEVSGVKVQGGPAYAAANFDPNDPNKVTAGWASMFSAVNALPTVLKNLGAIHTDENGRRWALVSPFAMSQEAHKSNRNFASVFINRLDEYLVNGDISKSDLIKLRKLIAEKGGKEFKALPTKLTAKSLHDFITDKGTSFETRASLAAILTSKKAQDLNVPSVEKAITDTRDPSYYKTEQLSLTSMLEIDVDALEAGLAQRKKDIADGVPASEASGLRADEWGAETHLTYDTIIPARVVSFFQQPVPSDVGFPDMKEQMVSEAKERVKGRTDSKGNPSRPAALAYMLMGTIPATTNAQELTPEVLGGINEVQENEFSVAQAEALYRGITGKWTTMDNKSAVGLVEFMKAVEASPAESTLTKYDPSDLKKWLKQGHAKVFKLGSLDVYFMLKYGKMEAQRHKAGPNKGKLNGKFEKVDDGTVELAAVVNNTPVGKMLNLIMSKALEEGANVLDAFAVKSDSFPEGLLPTLYSKHGWKEVGRIGYDPKYDPASDVEVDDGQPKLKTPAKELKKLHSKRMAYWGKSDDSSDGQDLPDVVFMSHEGVEYKPRAVKGEHTRGILSREIEQIDPSGEELSEGELRDSQAGGHSPESEGSTDSSGRVLPRGVDSFISTIEGASPARLRGLGLTPEQAQEAVDAYYSEASYSIAPNEEGITLDDMINQFTIQASKNKSEIYHKMQGRVQDIMMRQNAFMAGKYVPVEVEEFERRTKKSIRKESAMRQALRAQELEDDYVNQVYDDYGSVFMNDALSDINEHPAHGELMDTGTKSGLLESKTARKKRTGEADIDYDDMGMTHRGVWGGTMNPSDAASFLYENNRIPEDSVASMWETLDEEVKSAARYKEGVDKAEAMMKDAKKRAKSEARAEAEAWIKEAEAKQKKDAMRYDKAKTAASKRNAVNIERRRMQDTIRDLARLDAMLKVMPAGVRARVGGFTQVAKIGNAEGREAELKRRLARMDQVLERELVKDGRKKVRKLIEKSNAKYDKNTRMQGGKIGIAGHYVNDAVNKAMGLTTKDGEEISSDQGAILAMAEEMKLEEMDNDPDITVAEDDITKHTGAAIAYELFAEFSMADSTRLDEMVEFLQQNYTAGRKQWLAELEKRKQWREDTTANLMAAIGANGPVTSAQLQTAQSKGAKRKSWRGAGQTLLSFYDFSDLMGEKTDNPVSRIQVREMANVIRRAVGSYENEVYAKRDSLDKFLFELFDIDGRGSWAKAKVDVAIGGFAKVKARNVTKLEGRKTVKASISIADAENIINGNTANIEDHLLTNEEIVNIEDAYEQQYNTLDDAAKARKKVVKVELIESIGSREKIGEMSQLDMLKDWLAIQQTDLREKYDKSGYDEQFVQELEAELDPKMIELGMFLQQELREMTPSVNEAHEREYGLTMNQIENYFPAIFNNHKGNDSQALTIDGVEVGQTSSKPSSFKSRVSHKSTPKVANALHVYHSHLNSVIYWKHMSEALRMYGGVLRSKEMQDALVVHMGQEYATNLMNKLKEIETRGTMEGAANIYADEITSRLGAGMALSLLGMRLKTIVLNASGMLNVGMEVPVSYLFKGSKSTSKDDFMEVWNSPTFQKRFKEGSRPEIIYALMAGKSGHIVPATSQRLAEAGMKGISIADTASNMSVVLAYSARKHELIESGMDKNQAVEEALDYVDDIMSRAAQPTNMLSKSTYENNVRGIGKFMWMFASEARKHSSLMFLAWRRLLSGRPEIGFLGMEGKRGKGVISKEMAAQRLIVGHIMYSAYGLLVNSMYRAFFKGEGDEDEPVDNFKAMVTDPKEFGVEVLGSMVRGAPLLGEGVSAIFAKLIGAKSFDSSSNPLMRLQRSMGKVKKLGDSKHADDAVEALIDIIQTVGSVMPQTAIASQVANVADDVQGFAANTLGIYLTEEARFDAEVKQTGNAKKQIYDDVLGEYVEQFGEEAAKKKYKKYIDRERHFRLERYLRDLLPDYEGDDRQKLLDKIEEKKTIPKGILKKVN